MMPESQRIAIAEACGWIPASEARKYWIRPADFEIAGHARRENGLPDFLNDLNAMHEAEKVRFSDDVGPASLNEWAYQLYIVTRINAEDKDVALARATASQRAEAFLKTLDLWKEEPVSEATVEGLR